MRDRLEIEASELFGLSHDRALEFPKPGGAYDSYSRLIFTSIEGNQTYKRRLASYTDSLFNDLNTASNLAGIKVDVSRRAIVEALKYLIHSIAHIASIPGKHHYVSLSLNRNDYFGEKAQFVSLPYSGVVMAERLLSNCLVEGNQSYVERKTGHRNPSTNSGLRTRLKPTDPFLDKLTQAGLIFAGHPFGLKKRSSAKIEPRQLLQVSKKTDDGLDKVVWSLNRPLDYDEQVLPELNVKLKSLRVDFNLPDYLAYTENWNFALGRSKLIHMSGNQLYRRFADKDGQAGRIYGHWVQHCPSKLRRFLTFNAKQTIERDFSSMQLHLLYGLADLVPPSGDLYAFDGVDRHWMKSVLTKSVGARSKKEALAALRKDMKETAPTLMEEASNMFDRFWRHHAGVHDLLFKGDSWKALQYLDSTIALRVLRQLLEQGIICIPIHDSFIVQAQFGDQIEHAMKASFKSVFPNLNPILK